MVVCKKALEDFRLKPLEYTSGFQGKMSPLACIEHAGCFNNE